ncbi:stage II sporulation protein M [Candidatus Woesearchaeota archaeon]|nr:stage II sporulation protein M [Candidatus Woesearchaeota archaeon]
MVLESLMSPLKAEHKPLRMFWIGVLYATVAIFLSVWIFKAYSSLVMVFLTTTAAVPLMYRTMKQQEKRDMEIPKEKNLLKEHGRVIEFLMFLFLGFLVAYSFWYIVLPSSLVQTMFQSQIQTIESINSRIISGSVAQSTILAQIFLNNVKVLMFSIFFAFFYGAGAIFILTWNASVISAAVGTFIKNRIAEIATNATVFNYFHMFSLGLLRYMIHGIPEIGAYFVGGLAGGIISAAMINHDLETEKFRNIMLDALDLILIAIALLVIGSLLEVYITPLFF